MQIKKLDAARRQLLAAIHLQWFLIEPIATYQLAANAAEICGSILVSMGKTMMSDEIQRVHGWSEKDVVTLLNAPRNFTKHADRDQEAVRDDITAEESDAIIFTACIDYSIANGRSPFVVGAFVAWYAAVHPLKTGALFEESGRTYFPGLVDQSREQQILAARAFLANPISREVLHDKRNELTDTWRWRDLCVGGQAFRVK